jgi:protein ImuB
MIERDEKAEQAALNAVATALLRYSAEVATAASHSVLMEVSRSLRLFGGIRHLYRLVCKDMDALGFTSNHAVAPTAYGAWLLAQGQVHGVPNFRCRAVQMETLARNLDRLPYQLLAHISPFEDWLTGIGCRTLGDLRRLPRAGLKRRCHANVLDELDRAYGEAPEFFNWIELQETFSASVELPDRVDHTEAILYASHQLILQMVGWLTARHRAVHRFLLAMEHERGRQAVAPTQLEIALAEPAWQEPHLTRLLKERLERIHLESPVIGLRVEAIETSELAPPTESLFLEPGGSTADYKRLLELLSARLGEESILVPALVADHRPEICNRWKPAATTKKVSQLDLPGAERPIWLLEKPVQLILRDCRPFYGSSLRLVSHGERIECGWWDEELIIRDYFVATDIQHVFYWVYRERIGEDIEWYLHGLFG